MGTKSPGEIIPVTSDGGHVILDACLSYIKFLMGSESKLAIQNVICAKFQLDTLKTAREKLFKCVYTDKKYVYNGPKSASTEAQKSVHALEGILTTLHQLDQKASSLIFACPSYEMECVINSDNNSAGDEIQRMRLSKLESDISDLKSMKSKVDDIQATMTEMLTKGLFKPPSNNSISVSNAREFPPLRDRSSSVSTNKRQRVTSESDIDIFEDCETFQLPKSQVKRASRAGRKANLNTDSDTLFANKVKNGTPKPNTLKKKFEWGKSTSESSAGLQGVVRDIFITRCSNITEPVQIVNHLKEKGINVKNIEKKSRDEAHFKNFKVSVYTSEEYKSLISGEPLPEGIKVRPWIYYRNNNQSNEFGKFKPSAPPASSNNVNFEKEMMELAELEKNLTAQSVTENKASSTVMTDSSTSNNHNG